MAAELLKCFATGVALFAGMAVVILGGGWLLFNHTNATVGVGVGLFLICAATKVGMEFRYWRDQINGRG